MIYFLTASGAFLILTLLILFKRMAKKRRARRAERLNFISMQIRR